MKKLFFLLLVMALSAPAAFSQGIKTSEEELIDIATSEDIGFTGELGETLQTIRNGGQAAVIKQIGDNNNAIITQNGVNLFAYIKQMGDHLNADLTLKGSNNNAIIKQKGSYLFSTVNLDGSNNNLKLLQHGANLENKMTLDITGMDVLFLQTNTNFYYSQSYSPQNGGSGIPLTITGSAANIIVTNN